MLNDDDARLLADFMEAVRRDTRSREAISASIGGKPSGATIRRYERGELPEDRLDDAIRRGMKRLVTGQQLGRVVVKEAAEPYGVSLVAVGDVERLLILRVLALLSQYVAGGPETSDLRTLIAVLASIPDPPKE